MSTNNEATASPPPPQEAPQLSPPPENPAVLPNSRPHSPVAPRNYPPANNCDINPHRIPDRDHEWNLIMNFFFTAISTAVQSNQLSSTNSTHQLLPLSTQMACLGMVFSLAALVMSEYMPQSLAKHARFLEHVGIFFGVTGFFIEITPLFHLAFKVIAWTVYASFLVLILIINQQSLKPFVEGLTKYWRVTHSPSPSQYEADRAPSASAEV